MWEQHDATNTDVSADVLPILAEDASYKLWELANVWKNLNRIYITIIFSLQLKFYIWFTEFENIHTTFRRQTNR